MNFNNDNGNNEFFDNQKIYFSNGKVALQYWRMMHKSMLHNIVEHPYEIIGFY